MTASGASVEITVTDEVELGMSTNTTPLEMTTVVNEYGTTAFSRLDGRLLMQRVDPAGKGLVSLLTANGVSVAAVGPGDSLSNMVELIARIDLPGIERLVRPALPSLQRMTVSTASHGRSPRWRGPRWDRRDPAADALPNWELRIDGPNPDAWPVGEKTEVTWYLYAAELDPSHIADGERIASPWGRITYRLDSSEAPTFARATAGVTVLGTQGVKPLTAEESARLADCSSEALHRSLTALATIWAGHDALTRNTLDAYRLWQRQNGVIAEAVLPRQGAFATALRQR